MSKDELIRQLSIALSDAREVIKCAIPRAEISDWWQRDARLMEAAKGSFVRSLEKNNAGIPLGDARGRSSNAIETNRVKFHFGDSLGSNLMFQEIKHCFAHPLEQLNRLLDGSYNESYR